MSVTPPPDFWPGNVTLDIKGVTDATPPLSITAHTVSIDPATSAASGILTAGAQSIGGAKDFSTSIAVAGGQAITSISTDGTLAGNSDATLPTQKAVKTYVDAHGEASTASPPLYVTAGNIDLKNSSGNTVTQIHVTTGIIPSPLYTMLCPERSMTDYVSTYVSEHALRSAALPLVYALPSGQVAMMNDAFQYVTTVSTDGTMAANSAQYLATQAAIRTYVGASSPVVSASLPLTITARNMTVAEASGLATGTVNTTSQSFSGLKTFKDGIGSLGQVSMLTTTQPQLNVAYGTGIVATLGVAATGVMTLTTPNTFYTYVGTTPVSMASAANATSYVPFSAPVVQVVEPTVGPTMTIQPFPDGTSTMSVPTGAFSMTHGPNTVLSSVGGITTIPQMLSIGGEFKLHQPAAQITLTGAGPFNNIPLTNGATLFVFDCTAVTSNADITGFAMSSLTPCRVVYLVFLCPTSIIINLRHQSALSLAANRVLCYRGVDLQMRVNIQDSMQLLYDPYHSKWIVMTHEA
jgi:hypothetical protein